MKNETLADVQIKVHSEVNYALRSFWGVPSDRLHMLLAAPWTGFFLHLMEEPSVGAQAVDEVLRYDILFRLLPFIFQFNANFGIFFC